MKEPRINERIRIKQVRLIGEESEQLGVVATEEALKMAIDAGLDLVEVAPEAAPPVCRIMDFSKYRYDQTRKAREAKKKQKVIHVKEIRIKPNIEEHDLQVKLRHAKEFLEKKDKVKFALRFRGREMAHKDIGLRILNKLMEELKELGQAEKPPASEGGSVIVVMVPK